MNALTPAERMELRKLTRRIRTQRATLREVKRAIDLTNRDHRNVDRNVADLIKDRYTAEVGEQPQEITA